MQSFQQRREEARFLNGVIDRALLEPAVGRREALLSLAEHQDTRRLAERIRRRATWLGRHDPRRAQEILGNRDELVMAVYARLAPAGWSNAWCDGSSRGQGFALHSGIGLVLLDPGGQCTSRVSRYVGSKNAFDAELAALATVLEEASAQGIQRLRVHVDSKALVQHWYTQKDDPSLAPLRRLARQFKGLQIRAIPRLHNQAADALAKQAALGDQGTSP